MELEAYLKSLGWRGELVRKLTYLAAVLPLFGAIISFLFLDVGAFFAFLLLYLIFIPILILDIIVFIFFRRSQHRAHKHFQES